MGLLRATGEGYECYREHRRYKGGGGVRAIGSCGAIRAEMVIEL